MLPRPSCECFLTQNSSTRPHPRPSLIPPLPLSLPPRRRRRRHVFHLSFAGSGASSTGSILLSPGSDARAARWVPSHRRRPSSAAPALLRGSASLQAGPRAVSSSAPSVIRAEAPPPPPSVIRSERTGLAPCYRYNDADRGVPTLALHFSSGVTVALPRRNYFMGLQSEEEGEEGGVGCFMLMNAGDVSYDGGGDDGHAGTLGNFHQQGFEVVYDVDAGRVGFARRRCTELWDSLSRR